MAEADDWITAPAAEAPAPASQGAEADDWVTPQSSTPQDPSVFKRVDKSDPNWMWKSNAIQSPEGKLGENLPGELEGAIGAVPGTPGTVISGVNSMADWAERRLAAAGLISKATAQADTAHQAEGPANAPPTGTEITNKMFGAPRDDDEAAARGLGDFVGSMATPGIVKKAADVMAPLFNGSMQKGIGELGDTIKGAVSGQSDVAKPGIVQSIKPGATAEATGKVSTIGPLVADTNEGGTLGQRMMGELRPNYEQLWDARKAALEDAAPSSGYNGATPSEQSSMNAARSQIYNSPQYEDLRAFEQNPLGKAISGDTSRWSDVPKLDPQDLPPKAFKSPDSVKNLRTLLGGDQDKVESYASEHAAQELNPMTNAGQNISTAANAANKWMINNWAWLNEVPETKAAVQNYVQGLQYVAKVQNFARHAAKAAAYSSMIPAAGYGAAYGLRQFIP
jgi:hypothetical protein